MKIRDIVNRDIVNLENCESEPVHIPGSIQPHGFLIALSGDKQTITFCSRNTREFIGLSHEQLLGKKIVDILDQSQASALLEYLDRATSYADAPLKIKISNTELECISHRSGPFVVIEFERASVNQVADHAMYLQTRQFINNVETSDSLQVLCQSIADEMRSITGYDRVMIYRFDEQYNGEIFAESTNGNVEPFLGLHYPHTDIPVQARELYLRNLMRMIVDVNYKPVPVYTIDTGKVETLDMSHTGLRSVSPIHIQYLQNMGVGATLTISLVHEQKLWGLIACHHYGPKLLSHQVKVSAKLQGHFLTSQIRVRESNEEYALSRVIDQSLQPLLNGEVVESRTELPLLIRRRELLQLCNANGVAIVADEHVFMNGETPTERQILDLASWLKNQSMSPGLVTDRLWSLYPRSKPFQETAAGVIYKVLGKKNDCIIWFRHETEKEVHWGGDPKKAILKDENGLHPRKSFDLWKETVKGSSKPWLRPEVSAAETFSHQLQRQLHLIYITEEEAKYRALSQKLQDANAELENINWITAHDLKEPLRKIQVFASRILTNEQTVPGNVLKMVERMRAAAERMQVLVYDILAYARITRVHEAMESVDLDATVNEVLADLRDELNDLGAAVEMDKLPSVSGIPFLLEQVFMNLLRNAIKFRKADTLLVIRIACTYKPLPATHPSLSPEKLYYRVTVNDNGIGFNSQFKEKIFEVFARLHSQDEYHGSGIGLALCKRIMTNHMGTIEAESDGVNGSTFTLYFPA